MAYCHPSLAELVQELFVKVGTKGPMTIIMHAFGHTGAIFPQTRTKNFL
jgi:hypothetical protein